MYPSTQNHGNTSKRMVAVPCVPCCPLTAMSGRIINDPCLMARVEMLRVTTSVRWKRWRSHLMLQGRPNLRCRSPHFRRSGMSGQLTTKTSETDWSSEAPKKTGILRKEKVKLAPHIPDAGSVLPIWSTIWVPLWMWSLARHWWRRNKRPEGFALRAVHLLIWKSGESSDAKDEQHDDVFREKCADKLQPLVEGIWKKIRSSISRNTEIDLKKKNPPSQRSAIHLSFRHPRCKPPPTELRQLSRRCSRVTWTMGFGSMICGTFEVHDLGLFLGFRWRELWTQCQNLEGELPGVAGCGSRSFQDAWGWPPGGDGTCEIFRHGSHHSEQKQGKHKLNPGT